MIQIAITDDRVTFHLSPWHALFACRRRIWARLDQIVAVNAPPRSEVLRPFLRMPGTCLPWLLAAGTFIGPEQHEFWDVTRRRRVLTVTLRDHEFTRLVVEVADPVAEMHRLGQAVASTPSAGQVRPEGAREAPRPHLSREQGSAAGQMPRNERPASTAS